MTERDQNRQDDEQREGADTDQSELDEVEGIATDNGRRGNVIEVVLHFGEGSSPFEAPIQIGLRDQLNWGLIEAEDARLKALKN